MTRKGSAALSGAISGFAFGFIALLLPAWYLVDAVCSSYFSGDCRPFPGALIVAGIGGFLAAGVGALVAIARAGNPRRDHGNQAEPPHTST